jgi:hypothetical protein
MKAIAVSRQLAAVLPDMLARSLQSVKITPDMIKTLEMMAKVFD